jgi:hypothetical protein
LSIVSHIINENDIFSLSANHINILLHTSHINIFWEKSDLIGHNHHFLVHKIRYFFICSILCFIVVMPIWFHSCWPWYCLNYMACKAWTWTHKILETFYYYYALLNVLLDPYMYLFWYTCTLFSMHSCALTPLLRRFQLLAIPIFLLLW